VVVGRVVAWAACHRHVQWVNIFKPGKGTITLWENIAGTRGKQLLKLSGIPLTPVRLSSNSLCVCFYASCPAACG
jgi:hypothetical protein